jgi:hypothetical protein
MQRFRAPSDGHIRGSFCRAAIQHPQSAHFRPALDAAAWHARQKLDNADSAEMIGTTERMRRNYDERNDLMSPICYLRK